MKPSKAFTLLHRALAAALCLATVFSHESVRAAGSAPCTPPSVTNQPQSQTVCAGANTTFCVGATGTLLTYQWSYNGAPIAGATNFCYTRINAGAGAYCVVVANACGSVTNCATLTVSTAPAITCPSNSYAFTVPCGSNCVPANYPVPAVVNGVMVACNPPPGECLSVGSYNVICTATNACDSNQCSFTVTVRSNCPPAFQAKLLVSDSLDYAPGSTLVGTGGTNLGQNGGIGWTDSWGPPFVNTHFINQAASLVVPSLPDYATAGGSVLATLPPGGWDYVTRALDLAVTNREVWFSLIMQTPGRYGVGGGSEAYARAIWQFDDGHAFEISTYPIAGLLSNVWTINQNPNPNGPRVQANVSTLLVLQLSNITLRLWKDPAPGLSPPVTPDFTLPFNTPLGRLSQFLFTVNNNSTNIERFAFDEPRIATNYAGVNGNFLACPTPNLLVNGSFEYPGLPDIYGYGLLPWGDGTITRWTTFGSFAFPNDGIEYYSPLPSDVPISLPDSVSHGAAAEGRYAIDLAPVSGISGGIKQDNIHTEVGKTYHVLFKMGTSRDHDRTGRAHLLATVTGGSPIPFTMARPAPQPQLVWESKMFDFTAAANPSTLVFSTPDHPEDSFVNLDDVRVTECPLPDCIQPACPGQDLTVECTGPAGTIVPFTVTATNRCAPTNPVTVVCVPPSGHAFPKGTNPVLCIFTITNEAGTVQETLECSFSVIVQDTTPPTLVCAPERSVECGSDWHFDLPTYADACCPVTLEDLGSTTNKAAQGCGYDYTRAWKASDCDGNFLQCTQVVHGIDTTPPVFTYCPAGKSVPCDTSWRFDLPIASDACCEGNVTVQLLSSNTVAVNACATVWQGVWLATDCCANSATCTQIVTVVNAPATATKVVLFFQDTSGALKAWQLNNNIRTGEDPLNPNTTGDANQRLVTSADFNHDGNPDLLFQHADGTLKAWYMNGINRVREVPLNPPGGGGLDWRVAGTGDFNNDGKPDVVFQHTDGRLAAWFLDGIDMIEQTLLHPNNPGAEWRAAGVGDFNNDGKSDLTFQDAAGTLGAWFMNGIDFVFGANFNPNPPSEVWRLASIIDLDEDGHDDLIFQFPDESLAYWSMNSWFRIGEGTLFPPNPGGTWRLAAASKLPSSPVNCLPDKTVPCGTPWFFDQPTLVGGCCGTNVVITDSTETNALSPLSVTRTWQVTDCCSNVTTCSQKVTIDGVCPVVFRGVTNSLLGSAIAEVLLDPQSGSRQLVIRNLDNVLENGIPHTGVAMQLGAAQFGSIGFRCLDADDLQTGANLTVRAIGQANHTNNQVVATFQAIDVGDDIEYRARFDALGEVPLRVVLYDGSNRVATADMPSGPGHPPVARVTGLAGDARITPYKSESGYPAMILTFPQARPSITLTGGQPVHGTRLVVTPNLFKISYPERALDLADDVVNPGLNFFWGDPGNSISNHVFIGPLSEIQILASGVPLVIILDEQVGMFGLAHESVGGALVEGLVDSLMITPATNQLAAEHGFDIIAGGGDNWQAGQSQDFDIRFVVPDGSPNGAYVTTGIILPMFNTNELVPILQARQVASNSVAILSDFSGLGDGSQSVEFWRESSLAGTTTVSNALVATVATWPGRFSFWTKIDPDLPFFGYGWNSNIVFNLAGGGSLTANELRIHPINHTPGPNPVKGVGLRFGGDLQSIRLIGENVAPSGLYFQGLAHQPMGSAALTIISNTLVISNPAAGVRFGTSVALGDSDGGAITLDGLEIPCQPNTPAVEIRSRGTVNGVPGQSLGTLCLWRLASGLRASVDFTAIGLSNATAVVLDGSVVVDATEHFLSSDFPPTQKVRVSALRYWISNGGLEESITFEDRQLISLNGRPDVLGDRVEIKFFDILRSNRIDVSSVSFLDVVGTCLPSFRITEEELVQFHQAHQALGQADLFGGHDGLRLGNLVSGGISPDGVRFPLQRKDTFTVFWRELERFGEVPPGAVLRASLNGTNAPAWSQVTSLGADKEIVADFTALGASPCLVEVASNQVVVFSTSLGSATGLVARTSEWPAGFKGGHDQTASSNVFSSWAWVSPINIDIGGRSIWGNELRVSAVPTTPDSSELSSIHLQASGIPIINLVADAAESGAPITAKLQSTGGVLVLSWDTANPRQVLQKADNVNGPWSDVPGATTSPYIVRPFGSQKFLRVIQR